LKTIQDASRLFRRAVCTRVKICYTGLEFMKPAQNSGQALVLVLLSLSVVLTLVMYILSRSVTDIAVTSREEEAVRAFSAAEAGVERALVTASSIGDTEIGNARFNASVTSFAKGTMNFNYPIRLAPGDTATLWFVSHEEDGSLVCKAGFPCYSGNSLKVCWGEPETERDSDAPAIEVSIFYEDARLDDNFSDLKIARAAFDPYSLRSPPNSFDNAPISNCTIGDKSYQFQETLNLSSYNGLIFAKVRMYYNTDKNHSVGFVVTDDTLPSQGLMVSSSGTSGESNRRLEVFQSYPEPPSVFDFALFSTGGLVK